MKFLVCEYVSHVRLFTALKKRVDTPRDDDDDARNVIIRTRASRATTTTSGVLDPNDDGVKFVSQKHTNFHHLNLDVFTVVFTPQPTRNHGFDDGDADDGARASRRATRWDDDA